MSLPNLLRQGPFAERGFMEFESPALEGLQLPYHLIAGAEQGPFVCITGGMHGGEYNAIETANRIARVLDPGEIKGRVLVLPVVNIAAFWAKVQYVCPVDGKNPSGVFPGNPAGSFTEVLAHELYSSVFGHVDAFIDVHCGDITEEIIPFTIYQQTDDPQVEAATRALAMSFGLPHVILRPLEVLSRPTIGYMGSVNTRDGKPSIVCEIGDRGTVSEEAVARTLFGLRCALIHLGILPGQVSPAPSPTFLRLLVIRAPEAGMFYPAIKIGEAVAAGQELGHLTDLLGNKTVTFTSPDAGVVALLSSSLAAPEGDVLFGIGKDITTELLDR